MSDLKTIWKSQETEYAPMSLEDIRGQAGRLHSRIRRRNIRELVAALVVIAGFGFYIWRFPDPVMRVGSVLIILGTLYVVWQLLTRGRSEALPGEGSAASWNDYYRGALVRQRDALKAVWKWYVGPLVPGFVVFLAGMAHRAPQSAWGRIAGTAALGAVVFAAVGFLNRWGARRLQKKIDELGK